MSIDISGFHADYLMSLQLSLRELLFVRPYDLKAIESAAILLCDSVGMAVEGDCEHFAYVAVPNTNGGLLQCKFCGSQKLPKPNK